MKINEILNAEPRDGYIKEYEYKFDGIQGVPAFASLTLKIKKDEFNDILLGLFDKNTLVSYLLVENDRFSPKYAVEYSLTADKYQNKGCFKYLITKAVDITSGVLSDISQTPQARNAWESLIKQGKNIVIYDHKLNKEYPLDSHDNIWTDDVNDSLLLYFKKS